MSRTFSRMSPQDQKRVLAKLERQKKEARRKVILARAKLAGFIMWGVVVLVALVWTFT